MAMTYEVSFSLKSVRGLLTFYVATFLIFSLGYTMGGFQLRYAAGIVQPIEHFEAWMFYLGIALPIFCVSSIINMVVHLMTRRAPSSFLIIVTGIIALMQISWNLVVLIINLSTWFNCNDGTVDAPRHPECINRDYLNSKLPDWTFMIIVISSGGLAVSGCFAALMCYNAHIALTSDAQSYQTINAGISHSKGKSGKGKKKNHHKDVGEHMHHDAEAFPSYAGDYAHSSAHSKLGEDNSTVPIHYD